MSKTKCTSDIILDALENVSENAIEQYLAGFPPESSYPFELSNEFKTKIQVLIHQLQQEDTKKAARMISSVEISGRFSRFTTSYPVSTLKNIQRYLD